ncbi:MAG: arginine--tRNA ligase [Clostridiales bacterium]|jgi:arginyl-tRNA synthetase|nr:arginine--tRNA ligase [Clostridiales bacterium]
MNTITKDLSAAVGAAFEECGYGASHGIVTPSNRPELCQFQCNGAFAAAKKHGVAPMVVAAEVAERLQGGTFCRAEAVKPGFINITLTDEYLAARCAEIALDPFLGVPQTGAGSTVVVDYGGANVAKPLHVGHLRAAIIGEAVKRLARASGMKAIGDVHMGDWGLQMGLVIAQLSEQNPHWRCFAPDFDPEKDTVPPLNVDELNDIYPEASKRSKTDAEFNEKAHRITAELQAGHPAYTAVWREIMRVSVDDLKRNYGRLRVSFELWYGESDAEKYVPDMMEILRSSGFLRFSDGAQIVDVEEPGDTAPVPPVIVKKSDNSNMYATTDLATLLQRERDFSPDEIWYFTDKRQNLHFKQVFRCAKKTGIVPEKTGLFHMGFGTMNGPDGKPFKTREGGVMRLSELLDSVTAAALSKLKDSEFVQEGDQTALAEKVGIAALKFGDMINHPTKDYVFDMDKLLSFEGKTGVYLLYTVTRINSILRKAGPGSGEAPPSGVYSASERDLMLTLVMTGDAYEHALAERSPSYICDNAYRTAVAFSRFYHENHILTEQDPVKRSSWLALCRLTGRLLTAQLDVLGIETVENM